MPKPESKQCGSCYYSGQCRTRGLCDAYTPVSQELEELQLIKARERRKYEYFCAWQDYIRES